MRICSSFAKTISERASLLIMLGGRMAIALLASANVLAVLTTTTTAATYSITNIFDSSVRAPTGNYINIGDAAISGNRVAFKAAYDQGFLGIIDAVYISSGGPRTLIAQGLSDAPARTGFEFAGGTYATFGRPAIDGGAAYFDAEVFHSDFFVYGYGVFHGQGFILQNRPIVATDVSQRQAAQFVRQRNTADVLVSNGYLSYRSSSSAAVSPDTIRLVNRERTSNIQIAGAGNTAPGGGTFSLIDPNYDLSGETVAFRGVVGGLDGIYTSAGGPITTIARKGDSTPSGAVLNSVLDPAISGDVVAFLGAYNGGTGIFTGSGAGISTVASTGDSAPGGQAFTGFSIPAIAFNTLAFRGDYAGGSGLFTKRGGELSKVIATGDALFGSTVTSFSFSDLGLDPAGTGSLAFAYSLANGRSGVAMATLGAGLPTIFQDSQGNVPVPDSIGIVWAPTPNLANRNLTKAWLYAADLKNANAENANLSQAMLRSANLSGANLRGANLTGANLEASDLSGANLSGAELRNAQIRRVYITQDNCGYFECLPTFPGFGGITPAQLYTTANYRNRDLSEISFEGNNFTSANLASQNLTNTDLHGVNLTGAVFTDAQIRGASFGRYNISFACATLGKGAQNGSCRNVTATLGTGIKLDQLYATDSYLTRDLTDIDVAGNNLDGGNFAGQILSNASFLGATLTNADVSDAKLTNVLFRYANLSGANLTGADARGSAFADAILTGAIRTNFIQAGGHVDGLDLTSGQDFQLRDYGDLSLGLEPIPIVVDQHFAMSVGSTLRIVFDGAAWDSEISFAAGIPVALGGALDLSFVGNVNMASQLGHTWKLFDWTGVAPTGAFQVTNAEQWDLSNLYVTGEVTFVPEPNSALLLVSSLLGLIGIVASRKSHCRFAG